MGEQYWLGRPNETTIITVAETVPADGTIVKLGLKPGLYQVSLFGHSTNTGTVSFQVGPIVNDGTDFGGAYIVVQMDTSVITTTGVIPNGTSDYSFVLVKRADKLRGIPIESLHDIGVVFSHSGATGVINMQAQISAASG